MTDGNPSRAADEETRRKAIAQGEPLQLAPRLRAAARRLERLFRTVLQPEEIRLGGGTVLAARYGHRTSHDLDYWFTETAAEAPRANSERIRLGNDDGTSRRARYRPRSGRNRVRGQNWQGRVQSRTRRRAGMDRRGTANPGQRAESAINRHDPGRKNHKAVDETTKGRDPPSGIWSMSPSLRGSSPKRSTRYCEPPTRKSEHSSSKT